MSTTEQPSPGGQTSTRTQPGSDQDSSTPESRTDQRLRPETGTAGRHPDGGETRYRGSALAMRRSRGAVTGFLLVLLGAWGAVIPFIGPYYGYAFGVADPWVVTPSRLGLNVLPGIAVLLGGLILLWSANRASGGLGAWLALSGGVWFVIGPVFSQLWGARGPEGPIGEPLGANWTQVLAQLSYFYALGVLVMALAAFALGRLSMRSLKD